MRRQQRQSREVYKRVLVLCEGKTEKIYFLGLKNDLPREKQRSITIDVDDYKRNDPSSLVEEAIRRKRTARTEGAPYDSVWVVFDHDNLPNRNSAFSKAHKGGINIAYSSMNIEVWFLFHYQYTTQAFPNGTAVKNHFTAHCMSNYKPGQPNINIYNLLKEKQPTAIANANRLRQHNANNHPEISLCDLNPCLTIDQLIEYLHNL